MKLALLRFGVLAALLMAPAAAALAQAPPATEAGFDDTEPLWEIGVVGGLGFLPDYPAADEGRLRGLALPFAIYRGDFLRLGDRGAARGIFADYERVEFDVGIDAAFPVDADENDAREGMDDLDFLLEAGPRLTVRLLPRSAPDELNLSIAGRAVISTDFANWRYQGLMFNPRLDYRKSGLLGQDLSAIFAVSPLFGFDGLHDYFYRVAPGEALAGRPAFSTDDGYLGTEFNAGLSWLLMENLRFFGGVQVGYWDHAASEDSPLHRENLTLTVGGGLRWSIFTSEARVER